MVEGARAESGTRLRGGESQNLEGVRGLKALGVRDLNYRMAYLACTVIPCNNKVNIATFALHCTAGKVSLWFKSHGLLHYVVT